MPDLMFNLLHDATSGWLHIAVFFCQMKQYKNILRVAQHVCLMCKTEKVVIGKRDLEDHFKKTNTVFSTNTMRQWFKLYFAGNIWVNNHDVDNEDILNLYSHSNIAFPPVIIASYLSALGCFKGGFRQFCKGII